MIELKNSFLNPLVGIRESPLNVNLLDNFFVKDSKIYNLYKVHDKNNRDYLSNRKLISSLIYKHIETVTLDTQKKKLLYIKRKVNTDKIIIDNRLEEVEDSFLLEKLLLHNSYLEILNNNSLSIKSEFENTEYYKDLSSLADNYFFRSGLKISSPTMYEMYQKYLNKENTIKIYKKERNYYFSLYKYLTRVIFKTSPLSYFCITKIGTLEHLSRGTKLNKNHMKFISSTKEDLNLKLREIEKATYQYKINHHIIIDDDNVNIVKRGDKQGEDYVYKRNEELIILNKDNTLIEIIEELKKRKNFNFQELKSTLETLGILPSEYKNLIDTLKHFSVIVPTFTFEIEKDIRKLNFNTDDKLNDSPQTFKKTQDVLENDIKILKNTELLNYKENLNELFNILPLFDPNIHYKLNNKIEDKIDNHNNIFNNLFNIAVEQEIDYNMPSYLSNLYIKIISEFKKNSHEEIRIENYYSELNSAINKIPKGYLSNPYSLSFYIQFSNHGLVLNEVKTGFGQFFSKYTNLSNKLNEKVASPLRWYSNYKNIQIIDVLSHVGFNANLHFPLTSNFIDYDNIMEGTEGKHLNDFKLCHEGSYMFLKKNNQKYFPVFLGSMAHRHLPLMNRELCKLFQTDKVSLYFDEILVKYFETDNKNNRITEFPRVIFKDIVLNRKFWIINVELFSQNITIEQRYILLVKELTKKNVPYQVFMSIHKEAKDKINESNMDDFYKPQFIDWRTKQSFILIEKAFNKSERIIFRESLPNTSDIKQRGENNKEYVIEMYRK